MDDYILINGEDTRARGITCTALPPEQIPVERINRIVIPGRSGYLTQRDDSYEPLPRPASFCCQNLTQREIADFFTAASRVVFSDEPDKEYKAICNGASIVRGIHGWQTFDVTFECDPEKREAHPEEMTISSGAIIQNIGNRKTLPTFEITGSGTIVLHIGSQTVTLTAVTGTYIIDGELRECYSTLGVSTNSSMTGAFPVLEAGEEYTITWTGSVSKVILRPNWRWV